MPKNDHLSGYGNWMEDESGHCVGSWNSVFDSKPAESVLPNTVREMEVFGVGRSHKAIYTQTYKYEHQPVDDENPNHITLDVIVNLINISIGYILL